MGGDHPLELSQSSRGILGGCALDGGTGVKLRSDDVPLSRQGCGRLTSALPREPLPQRDVGTPRPNPRGLQGLHKTYLQEAWIAKKCLILNIK